MSKLERIFNQALGREQEPLWMAILGGVMVVFILPAIIMLYAVAFTPTHTEITYNYEESRQ